MMSRIENGRIIVIAKNSQMSPALSRSKAGVAHAARPTVLPDRGRAAPQYDATAGRWVSPPSSMTEDAGAAADLRHADMEPFEFLNDQPRPAVSPKSAAGQFLHEVLEVFTVVLGLTVFGLIAGFFLVLA